MTYSVITSVGLTSRDIRNLIQKIVGSERGVVVCGDVC